MADQAAFEGDDSSIIAEAHRATLKVADLDSLPGHARTALRAAADLLNGYMGNGESVVASSDRLPKAIDQMERSYRRLDQIASELEDRPVLQQAIMKVAMELEGTAYVSGPVTITVPKQHNNRLNDVLMAAFHRAHEEVKATETPEQGMFYAERMVGIQALVEQQPPQFADYSLSVKGPGLLLDLIIPSIADTEDDDDPWTKWVDGMIPVLRDATPAGSVA